jgi:uroporphyrinogen III methyltransferase / synthase
VGETFSSALAGKRIVITRAAAQSEALAGELSSLGAIPVVLPLVSFADPEDFVPLDAAIREIEQFDWMLLTSAQAVRQLVKRSAELKCRRIGSAIKLRIAAVGPVTAEAARRAGLLVEYVSVTHTGVGLANELGERLREKKVFLPRSDRANPDLPAALKRYGAQVTEVFAYRTLRPTSTDEQSLKQIADGAANAVLFFSPSAVHYFAELFDGDQMRALQDRLAMTAVGPVTAHALREAGVSRAVVAVGTTAAAVIDALENYFAGSGKAAPAGVKPR